jgi:dTMP kinase
VGNAGRPFVKALEKLTVPNNALPDLTFVLDLPVEVGLERARARRAGAAPDRFETEDLAYHKALIAAFRTIAAEEPLRCVLMDANRPANVIANEIWQIVRRRLDPATAPMTLEEIAR